MNKVITRILGGIGNQLFCYAAARRLSLVNNSELVIDNVSGFVRDFDYQRHYQLDNFKIPCRKATLTEQLKPFPRLRRFVMRFFNYFSPFEERNFIQQEGIDFDPRLLQVSSRGTLYLEGYWQSENYFKDVESIIRADLKIIPPTDYENLKTSQHICNCVAVAVHVRFFDAPDIANSVNTQSDYYHRAMDHMNVLVPDAHYFIFSDCPDAARTLLSVSDSHVTYVTHNNGDVNAYADLWLMTQCQHFIIANSTFSWWGAWLAEYTGKHVIAPKLEVRVGKTCWGFKGLLPSNWIKL